MGKIGVTTTALYERVKQLLSNKIHVGFKKKKRNTIIIELRETISPKSYHIYDEPNYDTVQGHFSESDTRQNNVSSIKMRVQYQLLELAFKTVNTTDSKNKK